MMTMALSVAGLAALFVTFGLLHRNGRPESSCGSCAPTTDHCATCGVSYDELESNHGRS